MTSSTPATHQQQREQHFRAQEDISKKETAMSIADAWFSHANIRKFLLAFHATADSLDAEPFSRNFFTKDIEVQYSNQPVKKGREANKTDFEQAFGNLELMKHKLLYFDVVVALKNDDSKEEGAVQGEKAMEEEVRIYQAARIRYVVKGDDVRDPDRVVDVPAFLAGVVVQVRQTRSDDGKNEDAGLRFRRMEIYLDVSRVFARMVEKGLV